MIRRPQCRRGMAPLEFVLVWPILLCLVFALFVMTQIILLKSGAAIEARTETWKARPNANPGEPLELATNPISSEVGYDANRSFRPKAVFPTTFQGGSKSRAIGRTWEYQDIPFQAGQPDFVPHPDESMKVAKNFGNGTDIQSTLQPFKTGLALDQNLLTGPLGSLSAAMNWLVRAAAVTLEVEKPILIVGEALADLFEVIAIFSFDFGEARMWARVARLMELGREGIDNLDLASKGQPVNWPSNMPDRIRSATP